MTMTQVSSDLEIVAVRASCEADLEVAVIGRGATSFFNRHRDRTSEGLRFATVRLRTDAAKRFKKVETLPR